MGVKRLRLELEAIAKGEADIVIGTQLVAKGHNFPIMTLVGIVDADLGLANGDPRAAERTFQLLQPGHGPGRANGSEEPRPAADLPAAASGHAGDRVRRSRGFYEREINEREKALLPPFGRLASIIVSADTRADAESHARGLRQAAPARQRHFSVLGPAEAPLALVRGRHRFRLLVHGRRNSDMQAFVQDMLAAAPKERGSVRSSSTSIRKVFL